MIQIAIDASDMKGLKKSVELIRKEGASIEKPLDKFAKYYKREIRGQFASSGRGTVKWKPLSPATFKIRKSLGISGSKKPLIGGGRLPSSIKSKKVKEKEHRGLLVFTRHPAAPFHQAGARLKMFGKTKKRLPKRPILFFTRDDKKEAAKIFVSHLGDVAKKAVRRSGVRK